MDPAATESDELTWKDTMYFWRGALTYSQRKLSWDGTWVSGSTMPPPEQFAASESKFKMSCTFSRSDDIANLPEPFHLSEVKGEFKGTYLMDSGDGVKTYRDRTHKFEFFVVDDSEIDDPAPVCCAAVGNTDFGKFVAVGQVVRQNNVIELTLARRYIEDGDPRASWTPSQLAMCVFLPGQCVQSERFLPTSLNYLRSLKASQVTFNANGQAGCHVEGGTSTGRAAAGEADALGAADANHGEEDSSNKLEVGGPGEAAATPLEEADVNEVKPSSASKKRARNR
jgi:hypothetical protein